MLHLVGNISKGVQVSSTVMRFDVLVALTDVTPCSLV